MKDHFFDCTGKGDFKSGGDHRHESLNCDEKNSVRQELRNLDMFNDLPARQKVKYNQKIRRVWEHLSDGDIDMFLDRNCTYYERRKSYRFN